MKLTNCFSIIIVLFFNSSLQAISWQKVTGGVIPSTAEPVYSFPDGKNLYIARYAISRGLQIGTTKTGSSVALIPFRGVVRTTDYEIFTNTPRQVLEWNRASGGSVPGGAIEGGYDEDGQKLYIARALVNGEMTIGNVKNGRNAMFPSGTLMHYASEYEVLCEVRISTTSVTVPSTPISQLNASFLVGNDDLRGGGDNVNLSIKLSNGINLLFNNINEGRRWEANEAYAFVRNIPTDIKANEIIGFKLETTNGGTSFLSTPDTWDLKCFSMQVNINRVVTPLFNICTDGRLVHRFTNKDRVKEISLK